MDLANPNPNSSHKHSLDTATPLTDSAQNGPTPASPFTEKSLNTNVFVDKRLKQNTKGHELSGASFDMGG